MFGTKDESCPREDLIAKARAVVAERARVQALIDEANAGVQVLQGQIAAKLEQLAAAEANAALAGAKSESSTGLQRELAAARTQEEALRARVRGLQPKLQSYRAQLEKLGAEFEDLRRDAVRKSVSCFEQEWDRGVEQILALILKGFALAAALDSEDGNPIRAQLRATDLVGFDRSVGGVFNGYRCVNRKIVGRIGDDWGEDAAASDLHGALAKFSGEAGVMARLVNGEAGD